MRLTEALERLLTNENCTDESLRIVEGHLRHLVKKEEGTNDGQRTKEGVIHTYVEYHFTPGVDFGLAYNEDKVWVCMDGVSLFRAQAVGDKLFSQYHATHRQYKWVKKLKGTNQEQQVEHAVSLNDERKRLIAECRELKKRVEELEK